MVRGYRSIVFALVGWLALVAASNNQQAPGQRGQANQAASNSQTIGLGSPVANTIDQTPSRVANDPGCPDQTYEDRESDLCAQWKAADAADRAAYWAAWSFFVGAVGTFLLVWTLWETREAGRREHRAYVKVEPAGGGSVQPDKKVCLPFNLINYGRTPALKLSLQSAIVVREPGWDWADEPTASSIPGPRPEIALHPDSPYLVKIEMDDPLPGRVYDAIIASEAVVFARGTIRYRDVFRQWRETTFQVEFHGEDKGGGTDGKVRIAVKGNDFT